MAHLVLDNRRRAIALGAIGVAILGAVAGAFFLRDGSARKETNPPPQFARPSASATMAFVRGEEGVSADIYTAKGDGSQLRRLTRGPGFKYDPDWSPDGNRLLYRYEPPGRATARPKRLGLVVMEADGTRAVDIATRAGVYAGPASWAPSGGMIAFSGGKPGDASSIFAIRADGSRLHRLTPQGREAQYPAWSPDGQKIAFTYYDGDFSLYVMDADGANVRRLTEGPQDNWPVWSPDSRQLAFSRGDQIWVINPDGSKARFVTQRGGAPLNWSPSAKLVFSCPRRGGGGGVCAISPTGTGFERLLGGADGGFPAWRPRAFPIRVRS
jgi:Tol biopolymer transport system component